MNQAVASEKPTAIDASTWRKRYADIIAPVYYQYSDLVVDHAQGTHLYTVDSRDVLDFGSGIAVTNLGHGHPAVVAAAHAQLDRLWHTSVTSLHPRLIEAAERLVNVTPKGLDQAFFTNSGAEAVESALKLARRATGRSEIIAFYGAFHGRTYGALTLTASNPRYHRNIGPFLPGVHHVRYPYCLHTCAHTSDEPCPIAEGEDIERLFKTVVPADSVAAIMVEPILGEGGYVVPPARFMPRLREICDEHGILLVADEVQSGLARTGKMFAVDHVGVLPDIMCVAKALGNGMPVAAIVAKRELMARWERGEHGTTYGGNAVACSAAIAVIDTIVRDNLCERSARLGKRVMEQLASWRPLFPEIIDIRGRGLMIGIEFMRDGKPAGELVDAIQKRALELGVLLLTCGVEHNVVRLIPPITTSETDLERGLDMLQTAIKETR